MTQPISALAGKHPGETAWIVGKGPSLIRISYDVFGDGPVITLNQAIAAIEPLCLPNPVYSMQKGHNGCDHTNVVDLCPSLVIRPDRAALVLHEFEGVDCYVDYEPRYIYSSERDYGLGRWAFSAMVGAAFAVHMGCADLVFISTDAMVNGDMRTFHGRPRGESFVEDEPRFHAHYKQHRSLLEQYLNSCGISYRFGFPAEVTRAS